MAINQTDYIKTIPAAKHTLERGSKLANASYEFVTVSELVGTSASIADINRAGTSHYDLYVDADFVGTENGTILSPFSTVQAAVDASSVNDHILIEGIHIITQEVSLPHGLILEGTGEDSIIKYASFDSANGHVLHYQGVSDTEVFHFSKLTIANGKYGVKIVHAANFDIHNCILLNNGWNGTGLDTRAAEVGGVLGYDSSAIDLQAFSAGSNISDGGGMRVNKCPNVHVEQNILEGNFRGIRISESGIEGGVHITLNEVSGNLESGIYLARGSNSGCENAIVLNNFSTYNANNGMLAVGGINNKFVGNEVIGNWNGGLTLIGVANTTLREGDLDDNNRSLLNGIGNVADASASIHVAGASDYTGTAFVIDPDYKYIFEALNTSVHHTGVIGAATRVGIYFAPSIGTLAESRSNIIKLDNLGFIGQENAVDMSDCNISNLKVLIGDNSYMTLSGSALVEPLSGHWAEMPFANHVTNVNSVDVVIDTLHETIALHDGVGGPVINVYGRNQLQSVIHHNEVHIIQKDSKKIQLRGIRLGEVFINEEQAGVNIPTMNDTLNAAFTLDLTNFQDHITSGPDDVVFFYVEVEQGSHNYPLFKLASEANAVDLAEGGAGTSTARTFVGDASGITWYSPDTGYVEGAATHPYNGVWGTYTDVTWNIHDTGVGSNIAPTFTSIAAVLVKEQPFNFQYKPPNDSSSYNIGTLPAGYTDNGHSIVGVAETTAIDITHVINVTKANYYGADTGTITFHIYNIPQNDPAAATQIASSTTPWNKAIEMDGVNNYTIQKSNNDNNSPLRRNLTPTSTVVAGKTVLSGQPWAVSTVFKATNILEHELWSLDDGTQSFRLADIDGKLHFHYGTPTDHIHFESTTQIVPTNAWNAVYVDYNGGTTGTTLGDVSDYYSRFRIKTVDLNTGVVTDVPGSWTNANNGYTGTLTGSTFVGTQYLDTNDFQGDIASHIQTTLNCDTVLPIDAEILEFVTDPMNWLTTYKVGLAYREPDATATTANFQIDGTPEANSTKVWLMGDGLADVFPRIHNEVKEGLISSRLLLVNMTAEEIINVIIT